MQLGSKHLQCRLCQNVTTELWNWGKLFQIIIGETQHAWLLSVSTTDLIAFLNGKTIPDKTLITQELQHKSQMRKKKGCRSNNHKSAKMDIALLPITKSRLKETLLVSNFIYLWQPTFQILFPSLPK